MANSMTKSQREEFLAATHVGVLSVAEPAQGPLSVPIWYAYEPGGLIRIVTGGAARKTALLRAAGRASMVAQTETAPYQYVSVEGPVRIAVPDFERDIRAMALRYLGEQMGEMYLAMTAAQREGAVLIELTPERWLTVDYSKMIT